jgi:hypothetical protein
MELSKSFKFFMKNLNIDDKFIKQIDFEIFKQLRQVSPVKGGDHSEASSIDRIRELFQRWKSVDLPADSLTVAEWLAAGCNDPNFLKVVDYAASRQLYDLDNFYWSPSTEYQVNLRLIIPYYYRGKTVGFTARLADDSAGKSIPKYYQQCPTDFVYNLDNQQDWSRKYTIVTEGVLDAYTVDGVSTLGEIGQSKVDIIHRLQKEVVVCPDRDKKGWDLVQVALDNNWAVSFPRWDRGIKDAAKASEKYGRLLTTYSIISSLTKDKDKIVLKWKLGNNVRQYK